MTTENPLDYVTTTWPEALAFFEGVIGLHDAVIERIEIAPDGGMWSLTLGEVSRYSDANWFTTAHDRVVVEMSAGRGPSERDVERHVGYDIIEARLEKTALRVVTIHGALEFGFDEVRFRVPD